MRFSSSRIIILGFFLAILCGSLLLMLPIASREGRVTPFLDTLFTATSAVCVTGLVVYDTATYWSGFGQAVILCLIQTGGMGIVTIAVAFARLSGRKIGLMQRSTMQEAISAPQVGGIVRLTNFIIRTTVLVELAGAVCLFPCFIKEFGPLKSLWYSLFHSISAFCNAGFDLMGVKEQFSSLTSYVNQPVVNLVIALLIITGGIGFLTWDDIKVYRHHFHKYRMQSKTILMITSVLIVLPALYFFFVEFSRDVWGDLSGGERAIRSFFQSVTPRTAGFNTVDRQYYEAGSLDGIKNRFQELWYITLPMMAPHLMLSAVLAITATFTTANVATVMTGFPSVNYATHTIMHHLQDYSTIRYERGYASAIATVLFLFSLFANKLAQKFIGRIGK